MTGKGNNQALRDALDLHLRRWLRSLCRPCKSDGEGQNKDQPDKPRGNLHTTAN